MHQGQTYVNAYIHVSTTQMVKNTTDIDFGPISHVKYYKPFSNKYD